MFVALDEEIRSRTDDRHSLDDVVRELARGDGDVDLDELNDAVAALIGAPSKVLTAIAPP